MFHLPNLAPTDSYSLWYTNSSTKQTFQPIEDPSNDATPQSQNASSHAQRRQHASNQRTPLARLRLDEDYQARRRLNVKNYGNSWIKPPGIPKSLYQINEEKRELEEHNEAMRREALAQELAEAEAQDQEETALDLMEDAVDLDEGVPDGDMSGLDAEESDEDDDDENPVSEEEDDDDDVPATEPEELYRETLVRGEQARANLYDGDRTDALDEEDPSQLLQEEDLLHEVRDQAANLDDDIPEADGYEHTDTEDELTSSDDERADAGILHTRDGRSQLATAFIRTSMVRSDGTQNSMDISGLSGFMSQNSSQTSSPPQRDDLRNRHG